MIRPLCLQLVMHGSNAVKNAWKMHNEAKDKWYVIYAKTAELKAKWMDAFRRERERVREDEEKSELQGWAEGRREGGRGGGEGRAI